MSSTTIRKSNVDPGLVGASITCTTIGFLGAASLWIVEVRRYGSFCDPVSCMPSHISHGGVVGMAVFMTIMLMGAVMFAVYNVRRWRSEG